MPQASSVIPGGPPSPGQATASRNAALAVSALKLAGGRGRACFASAVPSLGRRAPGPFFTRSLAPVASVASRTRAPTPSPPHLSVHHPGCRERYCSPASSAQPLQSPPPRQRPPQPPHPPHRGRHLTTLLVHAGRWPPPRPRWSPSCPVWHCACNRSCWEDVRPAQGALEQGRLGPAPGPGLCLALCPWNPCRRCPSP